MKKIASILAWSGLLVMAACSTSNQLSAVKELKPDKFQGLWYEIAHLPAEELKGCSCTTTKVNKLEGDLEVLYTCKREEDIRQNTFVLKAQQGFAHTRMRPADQDSDWVVMALDESYRHAMIGSENRKVLYIISRTPEPGAQRMKEYLNLAEEQGFDTSKIIYTDQSCYAEAVE